jgi:hypothetical protein
LTTSLEDTTFDAPQEPQYPTQYDTRYSKGKEKTTFDPPQEPQYQAQYDEPQELQYKTQYSTQYGKGKTIATATAFGTSPTLSYSREKAAPSDEPRTTGRIRPQNTRRNRDLDKKYTIHKSKDFKFGQIFRVFWSEPKGGNGTEITEEAYGAKGESFGKIRPFLVIDSRKGHSICLPILTYGGQGCRKWGVHQEDHAVIFSSKHSPGLLDGELITKKAIRAEMSDPREKLDVASRLNYAKPYTVEHNVKVCFIGQVHRKFEQQVVDDYKLTNPPIADRPYTESSDENAARYASEGYDPSYHYDDPEDPDAPAQNYTTRRRGSKFQDDYEGATPRDLEQTEPVYDQEESTVPHPPWSEGQDYDYEAGEGSSEQPYDPEYHAHGHGHR